MCHCILMLPGWEASPGAVGEKEAAEKQEMSKRIEDADPELREKTVHAGAESIRTMLKSS